MNESLTNQEHWEQNMNSEKKNRLKTTTYKINTKKVKKVVYIRINIGHQLIIETKQGYTQTHSIGRGSDTD